MTSARDFCHLTDFFYNHIIYRADNKPLFYKYFIFFAQFGVDITQQDVRMPADLLIDRPAGKACGGL